MPGQRWCRACFTEYRRQQRAKPRTTPLEAQAAPADPVVTHFWCEKRGFSLKVPGVGLVRFKDGLLETSDERVIAALRKNDWYNGIITEGEAPPAQPRQEPSPVRPREYPPVRRTRLLGDW